MKKALKYFTVFLLMITMLTAGNELTLCAAAEAVRGPVYVYDVQMFQSSTLDECVRLCREAGYIPVERNLNAGAIEKVSFGSDTDAPSVILGYTTTTNVNLAVTDISLLHMGEGYELREFRTIAAALLAKNQNYAEGLAAAAADFAENYDKGAPSAVHAYKMLDLMYVDELDKHCMSGYVEERSNSSSFLELFNLSGSVKKYLKASKEKKFIEELEHTPLGDYILEGNADADFFGKLLSLGTPSIVNAVNSALCAGSAEYENYYDPELDRYETRVWAERLYDSDVRAMTEEGLTSDGWRAFDSAYMDSARQIASSVRDFATQYLNAKARKATVDSLCETDADDLVGVTEEMRNMKDSDLDGVYMAAFEILNRYKYDDTHLLGDWIVSAGSRAYSGETDYRALYVLADALSPSQLILMKYCGFSSFVNNMLQPDEDAGDAQKAFDRVVNGLRSLVSKGEEYRVSVWMGVDNSVYYGKVAMTSDAIRQAGSNAVLQLTEEEKSAENARIRNMYIGIGTGLITLFSIVANIAIKVKSAALIKAGIKLGIASAGGFWAGLSTVTSFISKLNIYLLIAEIVITIALFIYKTVKNELHVPSSEYTDMPSLIFESKSTSFGVRVVKYNAIQEPYRGRIGDLNAYVGYKWNILYASHDPDAGSPLVVPENGDPFVMKTDNSDAPKGYKPVSRFGQLSAADMNNGAYDLKNGEKNFLFCATVDSQNGGNEGRTGAFGMYIGDVKLFSADTEDRAKAMITTAAGNYYAMDRNLGTKKSPCYLGYSLTNSEQNAVTDIRFFAGETETSIRWGGAEYTLSGELPSGGGLYISRNSLVGTPIGPELAGVISPKDAPEGWEPVVHFSGAPVAMFGEENEKFAIYFEPKVKFTGGELYLGGICFFEADYDYKTNSRGAAYGKTNEELFRQSAEDVLSALRWQKGGLALDPAAYPGGAVPDLASMTYKDVENALELTSGMSHKGIITYNVGYSSNYIVHEYPAYTLTYNPYRALRDVTVYTSTPSNGRALSTTLSKEILFTQNGVEKSASGDYAVCDVHMTTSAQSIYGQSQIRQSHAFVARDCMEDGNLASYAAHDEYGDVYNWKKSLLMMRGLYVLGPVEGLEPLKPSDIVFSGVGTDSENDGGNIGAVMPEGSRTLSGESAAGQIFRSVQDIKYPFFLKAQNLSYPEIYDYWDSDDVEMEASAPFYIYLKGTVRKPRYISAVTVGTYTEEGLRRDNPGIDSGAVDYLNELSEDNAWRAALAGSNAGIIPVNLLVSEDEAWNSVLKSKRKSIADTDFDHRCSYIGVSRTDDVSKAICGLLLVKKEAVEPGSSPVTEIIVGGKSSIISSGSAGTGTTYYLAQGSNSIPLADGDYYLYYSYNPASNPGAPLTDITVDGNVFASGLSTVLSSNTRGREARIFGNTNVNNYIHMRYEYTEGSLINAFYIGAGEDLDAALMDLLSQGAVEAAPMDINLGAGEAVALGWRTMAVTDEELALHKKNKGKTSDPLREAIRDVLFTVDEPYKETLIHNGVVYRPVGKNSLNTGVEGSVIYMYTCTDYDTWAYNLGKPAEKQLYVPSLYSDFASPLSRIGLAKGDRVPYNTELEGAGEDAELVVWENALSTDGKKTDLNRGAVLTSADGKRLLENRVYLFLHRADNTVKRGAEITGGFVTDTETVGALYGKNE